MQVSPRLQGECDAGDCASLSVQLSSSFDTHEDPGSRNLSEPQLKVSPASQVTESPYRALETFSIS